MNFNYDEFYNHVPVNQHDLNQHMQTRHASIANLCRGRVLDLGCGTGNLADYYFGPYTGYDISKIAIEKAKQVRRKDAEFAQVDILKHAKNLAQRYDTIVMAEVLEHFDNDSNLFSNITSWAKSNTRLIFSCPLGDRVPDPSHVREITYPMLRKKLKSWGHVKFYNWPGDKFQILCTCDMGQKNQNSLGLVMIVKDEELGLEHAIKSALEISDHITIAIDNATKDKTAEIAKLYADEIKYFDWQDDFSQARNFAHKDLKTKWLLFLDGHEYIFKKDNLEKMLKSAADGLLCSIELENGFVFQNPRLYKNGFQFEGKVHEKQNLKNTLYYPDFIIKHNRLGAQSKDAIIARNAQRDDMVPRLMQKELEQNPKNIRALFHLGLYWQSKGQFKKAIKTYNKYLRYSKNKQERWFIRFHKALCLMSQNKSFRAFWAINLADDEMPKRWETQKLKGLIFTYKKQFAKALPFFVDSFSNNTEETLYRPWAKSDAGTWNLIGECLFQLKNYEKASIAFDRACETAENEKQKDFFKKRGDLMKQILVGQTAK